MSLFHYIGSSSPLPLGERGSRKSTHDRSGNHEPLAIRFLSHQPMEGAVPLEQVIDLSWIQEDRIAVYDKMADAAGIYISELGRESEAIRRHFQQPYVYGVGANMGGFHLNPGMKEWFPDEYEANVRCIQVLFDLFRETGEGNAWFELYSCWFDEEEEPGDESLSTTIQLSSFEISEQFELKHRQYIRIEQ